MPVNDNADSAQPTILLIEDNTANLSVLTDFLTEHRFRVMVARDGESGIRVARQGQPDLILLDVRLPDINGFDVCKQLKSSDETRQIPVLFTTVTADVTNKVKGFEAGGVDYITKPFQLEEVLARVRTHLELRRLQTQLERAYAEVEERVQQRTGELKQANAALQESEERFRVLYESNPTMYFSVDQQGTILSVNRFGAEQLGYTTAELENTPMINLYHPEDHPVVDEQMAACLNNLLQVVQWECRKIKRDGGVIWVRESARAVQQADGQLLALLVSEDITSRKQAEKERAHLLQQVQRQAQQVQHIIDTVPEGVWLLDSAGQVLLANPVGEKDLQVLSNAQVGDRLTTVGDRSLQELLIPPPKGYWHEVEIVGDDPRYFEVIARQAQNALKENEGWVVVLRDVTFERKVQSSIQQHEQLAAIGELAAGIAHDFNNILAVILLHMEILQRIEQLSPRGLKRVTTVAEQAHQASGLIQQILDFSRRSIMEPQILDLKPLLKNQNELLARVLPENILLDWHYGDDSYVVLADPTRMQQIIMNLVINARDAMIAGGNLRIELARIHVDRPESRPLPDMPDGDWVSVSVSDSGEGIQAEALPHIFKPFFTTKEPGKGTGLGLAQVYGLLKQHEGYIDVKTETGAGTTFTFYLPAVTTMPRPATMPDTETLIEGNYELILIVEDRPETQEALSNSLEMLHYRVLTASNGKEAIQVWHEHREAIALVLSDVIMPEMSGIDLFYALRHEDETVKMILLSGHMQDYCLDELRQQGLVQWLTKPVRLEHLAYAIAQAL
jgi:two-component system cell cycle sensor histidine kinase/response regulator CckA